MLDTPGLQNPTTPLQLWFNYPMQELRPILRSRRERRLAKFRKSEGRSRSVILSVGMILSLVLAALIVVTALAYADLTLDLS